MAEDTLRARSTTNQNKSDLDCDQAFIDYLDELDGPISDDELAEWSDDLDMFLKGFSNPEKIKELWEQSKVKKLWDESQTRSADYTPKKDNQSDAYLANTSHPEDSVSIDEYMARWCNTIYQPNSPTPYNPPGEVKNLQDYNNYICDFSIRAEGGWPLSEISTHNEDLL